jgi:hypothetical protein
LTLAPSGVDRWFEMTKRNEYQYDFLYRTHVNIGVDPKVVCHTGIAKYLYSVRS